MGGYILGRDAGVKGRRGGDEGSKAVHRLLLCRDRRAGDEAAAAVGVSELERLGAISRVPELLNATGPLLQELGVLILERGIEELEGGEDEEEEKGAGEEEEEGDYVKAQADRGDPLRRNGAARQAERR